MQIRVALLPLALAAVLVSCGQDDAAKTKPSATADASVASPDAWQPAPGSDASAPEAGSTADAMGASDALAGSDALAAQTDGATPSADAKAVDASSPPPPPPPAPSCTKAVPSQRDYTLTLTFGGLTRTALVHVPPAYDGTKPVALAFNNHGSMCLASFQQTMSHFDSWADKANAITVTPQGTGGLLAGWNVGTSPQAFVYQNVDDVGFFQALIAKLQQDFCIDPKRVYCAGFSLGGSMCYRLSCEPDQIAAIASVSGPDGTITCNPTRAVPLLHFHGTADVFASYQADFSNPSVPNKGAQGTVAAHAQRSGCSPHTTITLTKGQVSCKTYDQCPGGAEATLCTVTGGGHSWPGGDGWLLGGVVNQDVNASQMIFDFFAKHPLPDRALMGADIAGPTCRRPASAAN